MRRSRAAVACGFVLAVCVPAAAAAQDSAPVRYDWSGFYIGVHLGGALQLTDVGNPFGASIYGDEVRSYGPIAGGQAGYNWQFDDTVLGVEAEISWADLYGTETCFAYSGYFLSADCGARTKVFGTLAGRAGWLIGPDAATLIYGKAGAAWLHTDLDASTGGGFGIPATGAESTTWGWLLGAGVERAISQTWSLKAEYDFVSFADVNLLTPQGGFQAVPGPDPSSMVPVASVPTHASADMHLFKVGVNYRLNPSPVGPAQISPSLAGTTVEVGARYVYGWSRFQKDLGITGLGLTSLASRLTYDDNRTNGAEIFARVDTSFGLMVKGFIGRGDGEGKLNDEDWGVPFAIFVPYSNTYSKVDDEIRYGVIDVGYAVWNTGGVRAAPYLGYSSFRQSMDGFGCFQLANPNSDCGAVPVSLSEESISERDHWQALRLGAAIDLEVLPGITLSADAAYLPYVRFTGTDDHIMRSLLSPEWADGTGAQLELSLNYALTDAFSIGVGGRYWAMWTDSGTVNFGGQQLVPMRYTVEQAALLVQGSYTFDTGN